MSRPKIKILIGYHKPFVLFKSPILVPIHLGRACATDISKDGKINATDHKWLLNNTIGDDTGDNISAKNRFLNEMTGIYWAWKNYDKLGDPEYIGFMQYGKHLVLDPYMEIPRGEWMPHSDVYFCDHVTYQRSQNLTEQSVLQAIEDMDCLCPAKYNICHHLAGAKSCRERLLQLAPGQEAVFDTMCQIIHDKFPEFVPQLQEIEHGSMHYPLNLFIMKKDLFFRYCSFMFGVLLEILEKIDLSNATPKQKRAPAFCSEFLTSIFITSLNPEKIKNCKTILIKTNKPDQVQLVADIVFISKLRRRYIYNKVLSYFTTGDKKKYYASKALSYYKRIQRVQLYL